jgi:hypothetical protein
MQHGRNFVSTLAANQRLAYLPYERLPIWVDDDRFRLAYHVRHTALPKPGDERMLKRLVGRIMSQQLDRTRPLWEMWFVEGLENDQFALISKTHHCMIDGVSGADLISVGALTHSARSLDIPRRHGRTWESHCRRGSGSLRWLELAWNFQQLRPEEVQNTRVCTQERLVS